MNLDECRKPVAVYLTFALIFSFIGFFLSKNASKLIAHILGTVCCAFILHLACRSLVTPQAVWYFTYLVIFCSIAGIIVNLYNELK